MASQGLSFAVLGPGGVGGLVAALLARAGDRVVVLASDGTAQVLAHHGLRVESRRFGDFTASVRTATSLAESVDACFVAVKGTQLEAALERLPADALGAGLVIPFLNGIEHVEFLRTAYPPSSVVAATIRVETARVGPGVIRHTSPFASVEIAATAANRGRVDLVAAHLGSAGLDVRVRDDEVAMLWDKFALLAPMALVTTHERANVGAIRAKRRADLVAVISEVASVAQAEGIVIDPEAVLRTVDSMPEAMESSMQRDQAAGRPLELDALGSAIVRRAAKAGVSVPVTTRLVDDLRTRTQTAGVERAAEGGR